MKRYTDELDTAESVILSLGLTIEARDATTDGHCQRLARYAVELGSEAGLAEDELAALAKGGFLHDIGKVGIPDAILLKPAPLTPAEFAVMKRHTEIGDRLCGELRSLRRVRPIVRHHHELLDGSGYPDGLRGGAVPLLAQIMGVVDVFDALTSSRPYKAPIAVERAFDQLTAEAAGGRRDRDLVRVFERVAARIRGLPTAPAPGMIPLTSSRWRHDITNQLGIILGFAELLLDEMDPADARRADIQEIATAAQKALDLIRQTKDESDSEDLL